MALDLAKYRKLFLEEAAEHLSEISAALLELEKDRAAGESIDLIFRMAHSIKSMAASLGYDSISELSHRLEDRMERIRSAACVESAEELGLLFQGLEGLERMVEVVRDTGEAPASAPDALLEALVHATTLPAPPAPASSPEAISESADPPAGPSKKKVLSPLPER